MLKPTLFAVTVLSFLTGLGALTAPQVLGGREFQTITPMILTFTNSPTSRDLAALLAVILGVATMLMLAVMTRLEKGGTYFSVSKVSAGLQKQRISNPVANAVVHAVAYLLFAVYTLPVVLIVLYSFADGAAIQTGQLSPGSLTLENYIRVLTQPSGLRPFLISIAYSALAAAIVVGGLLFVARLLQKYRNWVTNVVEYLLHIPWILPSALLALGLILSYDHPNPLVGGAVLTGTTVILLIAFVTVKIPFTLRMLKASFASVNSSLEEAAGIMGAKTLYIFRRILLPIVLPSAAAVTALNFNSMLDDYDTAIFLAHPLFQPLGLVIKDNTDGAEGIDGVSNTFVYTVLLMIITGVTMYLVYGRSGRKAGRPAKASSGGASSSGRDSSTAAVAGRRSRDTGPGPLAGTRPARVGLGEVGAAVAGGDHRVELAELTGAGKTVRVGRSVQHGRHPVGELLRLPHPVQGMVAVSVKKRRVAGPVETVQALEQHLDVMQRQIQALRARGRNGVGGVAGEEQLAVTHRGQDRAAELQDRLVQDGPFL